MALYISVRSAADLPRNAAMRSDAPNLISEDAPVVKWDSNPIQKSMYLLKSTPYPMRPLRT